MFTCHELSIKSRIEDIAKNFDYLYMQLEAGMEGNKEDYKGMIICRNARKMRCIKEQ